MTYGTRSGTVRTIVASPHAKPGTTCPNCHGPIPDLFGEMTSDPMAVIAGTAGIRCYYCDSPLRYEGGGSRLVETWFQRRVSRLCFTITA
jgi:hypothetical protein